MSVLLRFGEGCGNSFVLALEEDLHKAGVAEEQQSAFAREACRAGVDGLLILGEAAADGAVPARILNRDGSAGGTCLNGLRVAACASGDSAGVFVMDHRRIPWRRTRPEEFALSLGDLHAVGMREVCVNGHFGLAVDFWNPHAVFAVDELDGFALDAFAARCEAHLELFPDGVNVEMVKRISATQALVRVHERGVGETRACGSGAVAVALAAWREGAVGGQEVRMPGGALRLRQLLGGGVELVGPASLSYLSTKA
ncbi:MAG: hypothetical protein O3A20_08245 [Planctomycetota bacterium]|nr:hypothetical protein [Planctomycetota bacterium]